MTLEEEILELADYLGCNGAELWNELEPMFLRKVGEAARKAWSEGYHAALNNKDGGE